MVIDNQDFEGVLMAYVNKETLQDQEKQNKSLHLIWEIADCFHRYGARVDKAFPLVPYLLYKASRYDELDFVTFEDIVKRRIKIDEDSSYLAQEVLNNDLWGHLVKIASSYSLDEIALAVLNPYFDNRGFNGQMSTPESVLKLVHRLLKVNPGEKVADVCCGAGTYMISAAMQEPDAHYHGYEINVERKAAAMMKAELIDADIDATLCDVFALEEAGKLPKYDKIFADYPFGLNLRSLGAGAKYLARLADHFPGLSKATSSDWVFNALLCEMLSIQGKAIGIMTNGSTWNTIDAPIRKYFIENGLVECVISLPAKMFSNTNIATTLIVLSHNNESVRMIDATTLCQQGRRQTEFSAENIEQIIQALTEDNAYSRSVSIEELRRYEYSLSLSRYSTVDLKFSNGVPFAEVVKSVTRGAPCNASQLDSMVSDKVTNMQYLMLANIKDGQIDNKLPYLSHIDPAYEKYCLKNNALILSKNGYPYKVAVASIKAGQRILANGNLYIIELDDEKVDPYFMAAFFNSEIGHTVLKSITVGATIPNIGKDKLLKLEVPLPTMEEQNRIGLKYQATLDLIAASKLRLEKAVNQLSQVFEYGG